MRILYDGRIYGIQAAGGVNRYFANLITGLPDQFTPILTSERGRDLNYPHHPNLQLHVKRFGGLPKALSTWRRRCYFSRLYKQLGCDILHPTYYALLSGEPLPECRRLFVLTVYDMIHERFADLVDPHGKHAAMKRTAIESARAIICISENTKRDLLEFCDVPEERVVVIHLAADLAPEAADASATVPQPPFFVYVGSRAPYKNFNRLLETMRALEGRNPGCRLCVVGDPLRNRERRRIGELGLSDRIVAYGYATDGQLARLYAECEALVYPSMYEGFGIPPLEAMRCGTVVVAADSSSIPEVVDDAALLFDPTSTDQLTEILLDLLNNPQQRAPLIERGRRRAAMFSWEQTVAGTIKVYEAMLDNSPVFGMDHIVRRSATQCAGTGGDGDG